MHDFSSFVTLTYDDSNCPVSLQYRDFQLFMKRLRKSFPKARFYMCGEYGETTFRPHFHACLFGVFFRDRVIHSTAGPIPLYRSALLERIWPFGFSTVGDVTFESAAYCARYVMKKVTGSRADEHYQRVSLSTGEIVSVTPEFCRMSLKPGIGATWLEKFSADVYGYDRDSVIVNGVRCKPPRYYDVKIKEANPELAEYLEFARYERSGRCVEDSTPERLAVREQVTTARVGNYKRSL